MELAGFWRVTWSERSPGGRVMLVGLWPPVPDFWSLEQHPTRSPTSFIHARGCAVVTAPGAWQLRSPEAVTWGSVCHTLEDRHIV